MTGPHRTPRRLWMLYRVRPAGASAEPNPGASPAAARRERVHACRTPEGARKAAESDLARRSGDASVEGLRWERWDGRLVSEERNGVAYSVERYDVLEN